MIVRPIQRPVSRVPSIRGILNNILRGIQAKTARFAGYGGSFPTATTTIGSRIATNANSTWGTTERTSLLFTGEMVLKNSAIAQAYVRTRANYCRPQLYKPDTGDDSLNAEVAEYCRSKWKTMGMGCSMLSAVQRTLHLEVPCRGDGGLIFWKDRNGDIRLIEFSADQLGEIYNYMPPRNCSLAFNENGNLVETGGSDCWYFAGRYFRGADPVAYKIYERTNSFYANAKIYPAHDVIYCSDPMSFRGMRGIPIFAPVIQHMQKGEDMLQAALSAAQRQARTFGRVFNQNGQPDENTYESDLNSYSGRQTFFEKVPGGPIEEYYFNGDSSEFASPDAPGQEIIAGVETSDERVCIGLGMTYAFVVSGTKLGGAPSRLDTNRSGKEIERIENDISIPCLERIAEITILNGVKLGALPSHPRITCGHWTFTNLPTADAFKDSMDDIKSVRAGQDSNTRVAARYGTTFRELMRDKENEVVLAYSTLDSINARLAKAGIKERATIADVIQISDNPQQSAAAENITEGKPASGGDINDSSTQQARMSDFDEGKHPREKDGEFAPKGGGGSGGDRSDVRSKKAQVGDLHDATKQGSGKDSKITMADGSEAPEHIKPSMIPPAYRHNLRISKDKDADVWAESEDEHGNKKRVYNPRFLKSNQDVKWNRVNEGVSNIDAIRSQIHSDRNSGKNKEEADAAWLMSEQATRPGSEEDTKGNKSLWDKPMSKENVAITEDKKGNKKVAIKLGDSTIPIRDDGARDELISRLNSGKNLENAGYWLKSHGATTLEGRHVIPTEDGGARIQFMGKEGVWHDHKIKNPQLAQMLIQRKEATGDNGKLFNTNYAKTANYVSTLGNGSFSPKDLRTIRANELANKLVSSFPSPKNEIERKQQIKSVAEKVSSVLGNRPQQALESYINPMVFDSLNSNNTIKKAA